MKNQPELSTLTIEELHKKAKMAKVATGTLLGIIIVQFIIGIYLTIRQGFSIFTVIPITFLPIVIINFTSIKKIKEEIARRDS